MDAHPGRDFHFSFRKVKDIHIKGQKIVINNQLNVCFAYKTLFAKSNLGLEGFLEVRPSAVRFSVCNTSNNSALVPKLQFFRSKGWAGGGCSSFLCVYAKWHTK